MGEWPTIFDKSTTLTLGDGRRFFVGSPLGLGSIGLKIANYQTKSMIDALCCAVEGRQEKNIMKVSQLLRLLGGAGASTLNNQIMPRRIGEHIQTGKLIALPLPPLTLLPLAGSLGMARSLAPTMINLPSLDDIDIDNPDVTKMDETQRMLWVLVKCGEILSQTGKSEVAEAFKQLLDPKIIGLIVAGLIVWGASHFVGVGFIFDIAMVVVIGVAVLKAFETMWDIYKIITKASTKTELTKAAKMMADMVIDIGVETFLAIVLKGAAKSRFRAPPSRSSSDSSASGGVTVAPRRPSEPAKKDTSRKETNKTGADKTDADKKAVGVVPSKPVPCFDKPSGVTNADFKDQLKEQSDAINKTDPQDLIDRRAKIHDIHEHNAPINDNIKALRKVGGADAEIKALQKTKRSTDELRDRAKQLAAKDNYIFNETKKLRKKGKTKAEIEQTIEKALKKLDATHALDIIAGGDPSDISGMNSRRVNRSLGPQWKGARSQALENYAKKMKQNGKPMHIELTKCPTK